MEAAGLLLLGSLLWMFPHTSGKAPVEEVVIEFSVDVVVCRAEGIYPAPTLTWSTDPPIDATLIIKTQAQRNYVGLFSIESSLRMADNASANQTYICQVTSDTNTKMVSLKQEESIQASPGSDVTVPCSLPPSAPQSFTLTWTFRHLDPILSMRVPGLGTEMKVWEPWRPHVVQGHSASPSLKLQSVTAEHQGTYTCEVKTAEERFIAQTYVSVTRELTWTEVTIAIVVLSVLLLLAYVAIGIISCRMRSLKKKLQSEDTSLDISKDTLLTDEEGVAAAEKQPITRMEK
ncbi:uncharacterized protein ACBR49_016592 [Aulostomus maculatus]